MKKLSSKNLKNIIVSLVLLFPATIFNEIQDGDTPEIDLKFIFSEWFGGFIVCLIISFIIFILSYFISKKISFFEVFYKTTYVICLLIVIAYPMGYLLGKLLKS